MKRRLPPASWVELAATSIKGRAGVDVNTLADPEDALIAWHSAGHDPRLIDLDELDRVIAAWLAAQTTSTRVTYQRALRGLAAALAIAGDRPVRALLESAGAEPDALDERLAELATRSGWRSGTIRARLSALHSASRAMLRARLARRTVADARPRNVDEQIDRVTPEQLVLVDGALASSSTPLDVRTRAALLLAWNLALRPERLEAIRVEDLHLARACVVVDGELIYCGRNAADAVAAWLAFRGRSVGPLFVGFDGRSGRLLAEPLGMRGLQRSIAAAGARVGVTITLRALRNGALRDVGEVDKSAAQRLSGNASEDGVNRLLRKARGAGDRDAHRTRSAR